MTNHSIAILTGHGHAIPEHVLCELCAEVEMRLRVRIESEIKLPDWMDESCAS